jgi:hypothetical protein
MQKSMPRGAATSSRKNRAAGTPLMRRTSSSISVPMVSAW